ncbi:Exodeoxyribonuclease I subunit D [Desulfatibacillum alkenivorans DSM 16219]|jgi:exonuclease SbcD|uniref:Nuclease SbcCD subunit D n=1 Tax=Desulfatibacillum alkenivorans DSM 16219 TaxID=1121393 RepID=A0A1M6SS56_9BACT|nr:exonuclease SbcCD subunit D C-terminal domain-containing protein [Desulfatibacillum alkenivorans]SHK47519.1 Exodeoxyribonuclease I subunit D [Desulfatibacillum alkenivorans DSM 16219]
MKLIHTSDWHLGRSLYGRKRFDEFEQFLDWLLEVIRESQAQALLVSGDVFDTGTPSNRAQELYYRFLGQASRTGCRHVVITAGNHDSPTFLDAPKTMLRYQNVYVVGRIDEDPSNEALVLKDDKGRPELIVCAVPYLRDRDVRLAEAGESMDDKAQKMLAGIEEHYKRVCGAAKAVRDGLDQPVPIVAMGHLFTAGGRTDKEDGVRELYVGGLGQVRPEIFPEEIDYLALGHLHIPQKVRGRDHFRYPGSPLPMSFKESEQNKMVLEVEFAGTQPQVRELRTPCFRELRRIRGGHDELVQAVTNLKDQGSQAWLELEYTGETGAGILLDKVKSLIEGTGMEVVRTNDLTTALRILNRETPLETLNELSEEEVFTRRLEAGDVPDSQRKELMDAFKEILADLHERDARAE